jgi:hypothetical protein
MQASTIEKARATAATFKGDNIDDPDFEDAYLRGFDRGYSCASHNDLPEIGETVDEHDCDVTLVETTEDQADVLSHRAYEGESNDRSFTPFEFTAKEFNDAGEGYSDALWTAFDEGIGDGIAANITERMEG